MLAEAKSIRESKPSWLLPLKEDDVIKTVWKEIVEALSLAFDVDRNAVLHLQDHDHLWPPYEIGEAEGLCLWDAIGRFYYEKNPIEWMFAYLFNRRDPENGERITCSTPHHLTDLYDRILKNKTKNKTVEHYVDSVLQVFGLQGKDQFTFTNRQGFIEWVNNATLKYLDGQGIGTDSDDSSDDD